MDTINVNLQNLSAEERDALMKLIEKSNLAKIGDAYYIPILADKYYTIGRFGGDTFMASTWNDDEYDRGAYAIGNVFPTEDAAQFELERRKTVTQWKRLAAMSWQLAGIDPNSGAQRYYVYSEGYAPGLNVGHLTRMRDECTYFATREAVRSAISEIGEENVRKYILGIPETK